MPAVYPFRAVQYLSGRGDASHLVAPPYDVLDLAGKQRLLTRDPANIVAIDLPHVPAKQLGPAETYAAAADKYRSWLSHGTLTRRDKPAMFVYRQSFTSRGKQVQRIGMACTLETRPFGPRAGGGVLPHEETFSGPKEDRMALMRATHAQLSPIFGLHPDESGKAVAIVKEVAASRHPDLTADMGDGVHHAVWTVDDVALIARYTQALVGEDVFIADGHHRYTTGLNYLKELEAKGRVGDDHAARRCMFVLVSMSDPGLVIWPTHRVLGGMKDYSFDAFLKHASGHFTIKPAPGGLHTLEAAMESAAAGGSGAAASVLGLLDVASGRCAVATLTNSDPLAAKFPAKPREWRTLDVAIVQHVIVEQICQPQLNGGHPVTWAFPHTIEEVAAIAKGHETGAGGGAGFAQLAVIVRPTPLGAVRAVSRAGELMPQKSTFFYPKLATGLFVNPLE